MEKVYVKIIKCPVCGKNFVPAGQHMYKIKTKRGRRMVCSYHCMRKAKEKNTEHEKKQKEQIEKGLRGEM